MTLIELIIANQTKFSFALGQAGENERQKKKKLMFLPANVKIDILEEKKMCFTLSLEAANNFLSHSIKNQWLK